MASTTEYRDFILEQLSLLDSITYNEGLLFGGVYDDRLLVKIVDNNKKYHMEEVIPYETAKPMYYVEDVDNQDLLKGIVLDTCKGLKEKKK